MTVPQGAKIIRNKYSAKCHVGDGMVRPEDGAAILDVNITGKWATFHIACLPAPYEKDDVPAEVHASLPFGARRYNQQSSDPQHQRCKVCSHWLSDHPTATTCTGHFRGTPACTCTGFVSPVATTVATTNPLAGSTPPPTPKVGVLSGALALKQGRGTVQRIIVFSGPIHSASDGQVHYVSADNVIALHGISLTHPPDCTVLFFGPDDKRNYQPGPKDFVIGPRYTSAEYDEAAQALAVWLVQEGITS